MAASNVYWMDDRAQSLETGLVPKMLTVFDAAGFGDMIRPNALVAIKIHVGEYNNTGYLRPVFARALADKIRSLGGRPYVTDTTTLTYFPITSRTTELDIRETAERNGYTTATLGCPLIIADGCFGTSDVHVEIPDGFILRENYIAAGIAMADAMIVLTHFKGHPMGVYGGAIKNVGIGCVSKRGKYNVHLSRHPKYGWQNAAFTPEVCTGPDCPDYMKCVFCCPHGAITFPDGRIHFEPDRCMGCLGHQATATTVCRALDLPDDIFEAMGAAMADSCKSVVDYLGRDNVGFINMAVDSSPWCDCVPFSDRPFIANMGVFASKDPVAIDRACLEMAQKSTGIPGSRAQEAGVMNPGVKKFSASASPIGASEDTQTKVGAKIGLGSLEYELVRCEPQPVLNFLPHFDPRPNALKMPALFAKEPVLPKEGFRFVEEVNLEEVR